MNNTQKYLRRIRTRVSALIGIDNAHQSKRLAPIAQKSRDYTPRWRTNENRTYRRHAYAIKAIVDHFGTDCLLHVILTLPATEQSLCYNDFIARWTAFRRQFLRRGTPGDSFLRGWARVIYTNRAGALHIHLLVITRYRIKNTYHAYNKCARGDFSLLPLQLNRFRLKLVGAAVRARLGPVIKVRPSKYSSADRVASYLLHDLGELAKSRKKRPLSLKGKHLVELYPRNKVPE